MTDWRFEKTKLDPAYSGLDRGYNSRTGALAPAPLTAPRANATSRIIPAPSNTNWNSTFLNNQPTSPSGTDWQKTFGNVGGAFAPRLSSSPQSPLENRDSKFSFGLSPSTDRPQLSLPQSNFQDRAANLDLTPRDHELYGAGPDFGFNF